MPTLVHANEATAAQRRVYFHLVDATDGITPETGEAGGQPQISTNGGAWTDTGIGTLTAIGNGRYYADLTQTAVATAGDRIETRYKSAATAESPGDSIHVVAFDPHDADDLGLTNLTGHTPQTGDSFARLGAPAGASIAADIGTVDTVVDAMKVNTDMIGTNGDGLVAIPWNANWDAEVQSEVDDALVAQGLDHLLNAAVSGVDITDDSIFAKLVSKSATADWDSYNNTTDSLEAIADSTGGDATAANQTTIIDHLTDIKGASWTTTDTLEAIRDRGDAAWITATGFSTFDASSDTVDVGSIGGESVSPTTQSGGDGTNTLILSANEPNDSLAWQSGDEIRFHASGEIGVVSAWDKDTQQVTFSPALDQTLSTAGGLVYSLYRSADAGGGGDATEANQTTIIDHLTDIKGATWTTTDSLEAIRDRGDAAWTTATGFSTLTAAQVNTEVDTALADIHLDHLLAVDYDPASPPGIATALFNELIESDAGVSRFTANALEQAPTGGGGGGDATLANQTTIIGHLTDIKGSGFVEADDSLEAIRNRGDVAWLTATGFSTLTAAQVNAEVDTALADYDGPTKAELDAAFTEIKGATWSSVTDTLEAIRDRGDAAWTTATGFSTFDHTTDLVTLASGTHAGAVIPTVSTLTDHTPQTGDSFARLGAPAGASVSADIAAVKSEVWTPTLTQSYAAAGAEGTPAQILYGIQQTLQQFVISGLSTTVYQLDGATTAFTLTHDSETAATYAKRNNV